MYQNNQKRCFSNRRPKTQPIQQETVDHNRTRPQLEAVVKTKPEKIQAKTGFQPITSAIRCSALPTELSSQLFFQALFSFISEHHIFTCIPHYLRVYYELTTWPALSWLDSLFTCNRMACHAMYATLYVDWRCCSQTFCVFFKLSIISIDLTN